VRRLGGGVRIELRPAARFGVGGHSVVQCGHSKFGVNAPMATLKPFRGRRFDPSVVGSLSDVICPPYDMIEPELKAQPQGRSAYHAVHPESGEQPDPADPQAAYHASAEPGAAERTGSGGRRAQNIKWPRSTDTSPLPLTSTYPYHLTVPPPNSNDRRLQSCKSSNPVNPDSDDPHAQSVPPNPPIGPPKPSNPPPNRPHSTPITRPTPYSNERKWKEMSGKPANPVHPAHPCK